MTKSFFYDKLSLMIAKVVLEKYLAFSSGVLDYSVPEKLQPDLKVGQLVKVPFQKVFYNAVVVGKAMSHEPRAESVKNIEQILCTEPFLNEQDLLIAQEISDYYLCSIAKVLKLFLPKNLWKNKIHKPKIISYSLHPECNFSELKIRGKNQIALIEYFKEFGKSSLQKIQQISEFSSASLKGLIKKNIVIVEEKNLLPSDLVTEVGEMKKLNIEQSEALKTIEKSEKPVLLHGITGSGKTEVYLHVIRNCLEKGKTALVLVPEIVLTTQIVDYFENVFGEAVGVIHSKLSDGEKEKIWWQIKLGQKKVIIGSRSALFYPYPKLGAIVIDEAHEWTYKSDQTPRYHVQKVAEILANYHDSKLVMGTATPKVEDYWKALKVPLEGVAGCLPQVAEDFSTTSLSANASKKSGRNDATKTSQLVTLKKRIYEDEIAGEKFTRESTLPEVKIIDLKEEFQKKNYTPFSDSLIQELMKVLENKEQALLFLNKRGTSSSLLCRECGYISKCKACDVGLTYHQKGNQGKLVCHYCGRMQELPLLCPDCQSPSIKFVGAGTQKIERDLKQLFPNAKIARVDSDTTSAKEAHIELYTQLKNEEIDIVIGTQIIAKGFDLPKVSLVGILSADVGLNVPDFRSGEKIFHILTQVSGRAGRRAKQGKVLLQTYNPDNFILQAIAKHDYDLFYQNEIRIREELQWPPFSSVVKLTYVDYSIQKVLQRVDNLKKILLKISKGKNVQVLSAPALIPKMHNKYHWNIILKGTAPDEIIRQIRLPLGWRVDRDPVQVS